MLVTISFIDIIYPYNIITMIMKAILAVTNTTWAVVKIRPGKNSSLYGIWTHDLCDTGAALYQLSQQANWELAIMLVPNIWLSYIQSRLISSSY